jgi:hypothetical protein
MLFCSHSECLGACRFDLESFERVADLLRVKQYGGNYFPVAQTCNGAERQSQNLMEPL